MTVIDLVDRERARLRVAMVLAGVTLAAGVTAVLLALATLALGGARWIQLPRPLPLIAWAVAAAIVGGTLWWTVQALASRGSRARVAEAIERERALRAGSLRGALEVAGRGSLGRRGAEQVVSRLERAARTPTTAHGRGLRNVLAPDLQSGARWRAGIGLSTAAFAFLTLGASRSMSPDGWRALAHPVRAWQGTLAPALVIDAPPVVLRGERVQVRVSAVDRREITLHQRATGTAWRSSRHPVSDVRAVVTVGPVDADLVLVAYDGRTASDTVVIRVTDHPFVGDVSMRATFPTYLRREAEVLPTGEPARLPRGTVVTITGHASIALEDVELTSGGDTVRLAVNGHSFRGRIVANDPGRWTWSARGLKAPIADVPPPIEIDVIPDSVPQVEIVEPGADTIVTGREELPISIAAVDDHGLATVTLQSWRQPATGRQAQPAVEARLGPPSGTQWNGSTTIDLQARGLRPGDALHVVAIATDGSPWAQSAMSRELVIRIPTSSEQREMARDASDSAVAAAGAAVSAQRDLERRTADAARARTQSAADGQSSSSNGSRDAMSFEQAERARALTEEQRAMLDRIDELKRSAADMEEQLRQAGALDSGLAARLAEARAMLDEALTPELADQMRKLEEALKNLSADEARSAMGDLREQQQRLREQLEKSAEMLKRAALEGTMQTLRDEAAELAAAERALADSLARNLEARDSAAARRENARDLEQRSRELSSDVSQLSQRLAKENAETGARKTDAAQQQAAASAEAMQRAAQSMSGDQQANAQQRANQQNAQQTAQQNQQQQRGAQAADEAAKAMERAAQQLADARASQIDEWKSELTGELDQSIQEMLQLARQQERLEQQVRQGANRENLRGDQSALQQGVQKAGERLEAAGQKSSLLSPQSQRAAGEARAKVEQATRELTEGKNQGQTAGAMRDASEALNRAAASLVRDRDRANSASSASGFSEMLQQLQEMAQRQGGLNAQAAGLMQLPGGLQSAEAQERARQLAREQRSLARDLENLGDPTGRAEDLAREAQRIAEALNAGGLDEATIQRQQRLFRRMLDAGRTLEQDEQDDSGRREAQAAKPGETVTPTGPGRGEDAVRFREPTWNELRGLAPEERRAVLEYFKRINGGGAP
jgi:hypothetical protein